MQSAILALNATVTTTPMRPPLTLSPVAARRCCEEGLVPAECMAEHVWFTEGLYNVPSIPSSQRPLLGPKEAEKEVMDMTSQCTRFTVGQHERYTSFLLGRTRPRSK
eukprot:4601622-Amphidinium_carterae.2